MSRLKEPSTWGGLGTIFTALAAIPSPASPFLVAAAGVCGGLAVMLRETGKPASTTATGDGARSGTAADGEVAR